MAQGTATVTLKPGREASLLRRHPWIFSGAVAATSGELAPGTTVRVRAADGRWLAVGAYSPTSQIRVRVWSFDPADEVSSAFLHQRLARAIARRTRQGAQLDVGARRLVYGEADGFPGLIVDRYADFLVVQFLAAGVFFWQQEIVQALADLLPVRGIYERSEGEARSKEGLAPACGCLAGQPPPELIVIEEGELRFQVDVRCGHKTGFYLDQRENRRLLAGWTAGCEVLNCFAYTGGFGLWALFGGAASVINVESSAPMLALLEQNLSLNPGLTAANPTVVNLGADVFQVLRQFRDQSRQFDVIVLDPPKFAANAGQLERACRGYKDINLLALKLLRPGGLLATFSCSGHVDPPLFQKILADSAVDAGRSVEMVRSLTQAPDHPVFLHFPEGHYLKGWLLRAE